jgi:hypothetical protein
MPPRKAKNQNKTKKRGTNTLLDQSIPNKAQAEEENEWYPIEIHGNPQTPTFPLFRSKIIQKLT